MTKRKDFFFKGMLTRADMFDLIREIDHFHGNELKDRSKDSVEDEIDALLDYFKRMK
jgi:hypothetical protein